MQLKSVFLSLFLMFQSVLCAQSKTFVEKITTALQATEIERAKEYLNAKPETVTDSFCERSAGGIHDFYSEGDYWWPDPLNPGGPYIQKDGQTNPENFNSHRFAMIKLSETLATLTAAWLLTHDQIYADKALEHLNAWFVNPATAMNPNLLYAQAIYGK